MQQYIIFAQFHNCSSLLLQDSVVHMEHLESLLKIMRRRKETSVKETHLNSVVNLKSFDLTEHVPVKIRQDSLVSGPASSPNPAAMTSVQRRPPGLPGVSGQSVASPAGEAGARGRGQDLVRRQLLTQSSSREEVSCSHLK